MKGISYRDVHGIAEELGVDVQTVRRWIHSGRLRAFKPGKEYRVRESDLEEFLAAREVRPKVEAPLEEGQPSFNDALAEERRAKWDAAVRSARQLREHGRTRMEGLLSSWHESREREEPYEARRAYLDESGELLQRAYDATTALFKALYEPRIAEQWPEVQTADLFYAELRHLVQGAGLSIRTDGAQQGEHAPPAQPESHTVQEAA